MNIITNKQLTVFSILIACMVAMMMIGYWQIMDYSYLPTVIKDDAGTCTQVINSKNGDAYNCNDVNVTLRRYKNATK